MKRSYKTRHPALLMHRPPDLGLSSSKDTITEQRNTDSTVIRKTVAVVPAGWSRHSQSRFAARQVIMLHKPKVTYLKTVLHDTKHMSWRARCETQGISHDPLLSIMEPLKKCYAIFGMVVPVLN